MLNKEELGIAIIQMLESMTDREAKVVANGPIPNGDYVLIVKIDNRQFTVRIEGE